MAFKEDFDAFLSTSDFAEELEWNGSSFNGIFDNETYSVEGADSPVPVDIQQPKFLTKDAAIVGIKQGDSVLRISTSTIYIVQSLAPDGTGMTEVRLSRA